MRTTYYTITLMYYKATYLCYLQRSSEEHGAGSDNVGGGLGLTGSRGMILLGLLVLMVVEMADALISLLRRASPPSFSKR